LGDGESAFSKGCIRSRWMSNSNSNKEESLTLGPGQGGASCGSWQDQIDLGELSDSKQLDEHLALEQGL
jgi:hypothetical protein